VELAEGTGFVLPDDVDPAPQAPPSARLLPGLDPSTMGWKQRAFHLDPEHVPVLFDRNGNGGPAAWVDGRIVGGWVQRRDGEIALRLLTDVGADARAELDRHAAELPGCSARCASAAASPPPCRRSCWPDRRTDGLPWARWTRRGSGCSRGARGGDDRRTGRRGRR
jgi:hypothetical protein